MAAERRGDESVVGADGETRGLPSQLRRARPPPPPQYSAALLEELSYLVPGAIYRERYEIMAGAPDDKPLVRFVENVHSGDACVMKFCTSLEEYNTVCDHHRATVHSEHVGRLNDIMPSGPPNLPCLIYQKGIETLEHWLMGEERLYIEKKALLHHVLIGLRDLHKHEIVHCNLKPSNIMLFKHLKWKAVDLHAAAKMGSPSRGGDDLAYVAPEVLAAELEDKEVIPAHSSVDMWAFGVIAYEVIKGKPFHGPNATEASIMNFALSDQPLPTMDGIERDIAVLIRKVLNRDPSKRWSSRRAFKTEVFRPSEDLIATVPKNEAGPSRP